MEKNDRFEALAVTDIHLQDTLTESYLRTKKQNKEPLGSGPQLMRKDTE
jgi:hypothetical protein